MPLNSDVDVPELSGEDGYDSEEFPYNPDVSLSSRSTSSPKTPSGSLESRASGVNRVLFNGSGGSSSSTAALSGRPASSDNMQLMILDEIKKANSRLDVFSDRLEAMENRLTSIESTDLYTPGSSSAEKVKRKVPAKVSVSI